MPGSLVLVGGEPGVGKSTLMLQVKAAGTRHGNTVRSAITLLIMVELAALLVGTESRDEYLTFALNSGFCCEGA